MVVPSDQALGWRDSYGTWDLGSAETISRRATIRPNPPSCCFAHDGDNAWSGGYSYYMEWVPNFASQASRRRLRARAPSSSSSRKTRPTPTTSCTSRTAAGFLPTAISARRFSSTGIGRRATPTSSGNVVDPSLGTSDKADNWRVIIATENRVKTAQQIAGVTPRIDQVRDPGSFGTTPNAVELGWHYYLAGLDSGFVYYGCHDDECQRAVVAQSNAVRNVNAILTAQPDRRHHAADALPAAAASVESRAAPISACNTATSSPSPTNSDFWVWTYAYDVSGITNVTLVVPRQRHQPADHRPVQDLRRRRADRRRGQPRT